MSDLKVQQPSVNKLASELTSEPDTELPAIVAPRPASTSAEGKHLYADPPLQTSSVNAVIENYLEQLLIEATEPASVAPIVNLAAEQQQVGTDKAITNDIDNVIGQYYLGNRLPELNWQQHCGVECLLFDVHGLKLAVPLVHLGGVTKLDQDLTPIPGQAGWCLGVYRYHEQSIVVVDSAQYLMPERCPGGVSMAPRYIIKLANQPWALTCQGIVTTHGFSADEIKWRGVNSKRQWLAGTIISEMCALLDIKGLVNSLQQKYWQGIIPTNKS